MSAHQRDLQRGRGNTIRWAVAGALLLLGSAVGSYAYWTDSVTVTGTTMSSGVLDLRVNGADTITAFAGLNIAQMAPGQSVATVFTVRNAGTIPLTYYVDGSTTNADGRGLGAALAATVTGASTVTGSSPTQTCGGSALPASGTSLSAGLLGSPTSQRTLGAGASETVCVQVRLATTAPSSLQGATTTAAFTFTASQVIP